MTELERLQQLRQQCADAIKRETAHLEALQRDLAHIDAEIITAQWEALGVQPGDKILITQAIFDSLMIQEYSRDYYRLGAEMQIVRINRHGNVEIGKGDHPTGAPILPELVAEGRRAWLEQEGK
jgi:hypothetical protein